MGQKVTLTFIRTNVIQRARSTLLADPRFPRPAIRGNPNLYDLDDVGRYVDLLVAESEAKRVQEGATKSARARAVRQGVATVSTERVAPAPRSKRSRAERRPS